MKIPLQALILLTGVLMFVFYPVQPAADAVQPGARSRAFRASAARGRVSRRSKRSSRRRSRRASAAAQTLAPANVERQCGQRQSGVSAGRRRRAGGPRQRRDGARARTVDSTTTRDADVNYVFPTFVTTQMPIGLVGLIIAAIFAAAMSSIAAELNSLATSTVIDIYRRHLEADGRAMRTTCCVSRLATGVLGLCSRASWRCSPPARVADRGGQPVRVVLLRIAARCLRAGLGSPRERPRRVRRPGGRHRRRVAPSRCTRRPQVSFLWLNVVGAVVVMVVGARRQRDDRRLDRQTAG